MDSARRQIGQAAGIASVGMLRGIGNLGVSDSTHRSYSGSLISRYAGTQQIGNSNGGDDQDKWNGQHSEISQNEAGDGDALSLQASGAFANLGKGEMAKNNSDDGRGQQQKGYATDQAGDGFAAGCGWSCRRDRDRRRWGREGSGRDLCAADSAETFAVRNRVTANGTQHSRSTSR